MKEKIRLLNPIQILSNIALLIVLIIVIATKNTRAFDIYWFVVPVSILGNVYFIGKWSKRGTNVENRKSKEVARSLDDTTTLITIFYTLIYLAIIFIEMFEVAIRTNLYVVVGFFILTIVYELFAYSSVYSAIRDTKNLVNEKFSQKK